MGRGGWKDACLGWIHCGLEMVDGSRESWVQSSGVVCAVFVGGSMRVMERLESWVRVRERSWSWSCGSSELKS